MFAALIAFGGGGGDFGGEGGPPGLVLFGGDDEDGAFAIFAVTVLWALGGVAEKGGEGVVVALRDGIEFMIVALRTIGGESEVDPADGLDAVRGIEGEVFFIDGATFIGGDVAALESGGDELLGGGIGEEVAGDLIGGELVEGEVVVEGGDDPVAVGPHFAIVVEVHAVGVGITSGVQPVAGAMFTEGGALEEFVDELGVGRVGQGSVWGFGEVTGEDVWRGRETGQVE